MLKEENIYGTPTPHVLCEGKWIPTEEVDFLDISEDTFGRDIMKFKYDGREYESHIAIKFC
jgi:hypothetical protein